MSRSRGGGKRRPIPVLRRRRRDILIIATLLISALLAGVALWFTGDAHHSRLTSGTADTAEDPWDTPPRALAPQWSAPSPLTAPPVSAGPLTEGGTSIVVTAEDHAIIGRDAVSGEQRWRYERDRSLCSVTVAWSLAVSSWRDDRGCSQVLGIRLQDGTYGPTRSSDQDDDAVLRAGYSSVIARGSRRLETWRSDLVRLQEYGRVDAPLEPELQPRQGCTLLDATADAGALAVLEQCPGEAERRLTSLADVPAESNAPEVEWSVLVPATTERVLGVTPQVVLVAGRGGIATYARTTAKASESAPGAHVADLTLPPDAAAALAAEPAPDSAPVAPVAKDGLLLATLHGTLVAISTRDVPQVRWTLPGVLGRPALLETAAGPVVMAPVAGGLALRHPVTGADEGLISVDRRLSAGAGAAVSVAITGRTVLEQHGTGMDSVVVALRAPSAS